jgi:hypothetical protein
MRGLHRLSAPASVRRLGAAEDGFTMVFALVLLVLGIAVGAAALADTLASRSHTNLDQRQRRALQAADFGVQEVLYRVNQLNLDSLDLSGGETGLPVCVVHESNGEWKTKSPVAGVCPKIEEEIGNHDSYQAEFIPNEKVPTNGSGINFIEPKIISLGVDENANTALNAKNEYVDPTHKVYARVEAGLGTIEPFKTVEANHDLIFKVPLSETFNGTARAAHNVKFKGETALTHVFTATNLKLSGELVAPSKIEYGCKPEVDQGLLGNNVLILPSKPSVVIGPVGEGKGTEKEIEEYDCSHPYFKRSSIRIAGSKPNCGKNGEELSCLGLAGYESAGDNIKMDKGKTLTLEPGVEYVFCSLWTNGPIRLATTASNNSLPVRIFIDNPESARCNGKFKPYTAENGETVEAGSFYAGQGVGNNGLQALSPSQIQVYLAGSGEVDQTKFTSVASGIDQAFLLYAPQSNVNVTGLSFAGTLIGYDTTISAAAYTQDLGLNNYPLSNSTGVFHVAGYTQCGPLPEPITTPPGGLTGIQKTDLSGC